jgi:competence protein ComFC
MKSITRLIKEFIFPPICLVCESIDVIEHGHMCSSCWKIFPFLSGVQCNVCGTPYQNNICTTCSRYEILFNRGFGLFWYNNISMDIIYKLKNGRWDIARWLAPMLYRILRNNISSVDLVTSAPISTYKLFRRGYNQAEVIGIEIAKLFDVKYINLLNQKYTKDSKTLSAAERSDNLIIYASKNIKEVSGKKILLVDDVRTTCATLNLCTKILLDNGASEVYTSVLGITPFGVVAK